MLLSLILTKRTHFIDNTIGALTDSTQNGVLFNNFVVWKWFCSGFIRWRGKIRSISLLVRSLHGCWKWRLLLYILCWYFPFRPPQVAFCRSHISFSNIISFQLYQILTHSFWWCPFGWRYAHSFRWWLFRWWYTHSFWWWLFRWRHAHGFRWCLFRWLWIYSWHLTVFLL